MEGLRPSLARASPSRARAALCAWGLASLGAAGDAGACSCDLLAWPPPPAEGQAWEYQHKCDIPVLDAVPSQEAFDDLYFGKSPVLIRNGTREWPAKAKWQKPALWERLQGHAEQNVAHFHTDNYWVSYYVHNRSSMDIRLTEFLCHKVCQPPSGAEGHDQLYAFDRDELMQAMPSLTEDYAHLGPLEKHFEPGWHERWSRYFLMSGFGSGINFHQHTDAYNGLVYGRKRWFLYPPEEEPPSFRIGALAWFKTVYRREWDGRGSGQGLLQCMQGEGDLLYVPRNWWHATVSLAEGIGVSGQLVRMTFKILGEASKAEKSGEYAKAYRLYRKVWSHRADVEANVAPAVLFNMAVVRLRQGKLDKAEKLARQYIALPGLPSPEKGMQILEEVRRQRQLAGEL